MNRVLFTHSYFLRFDPKQWRAMQPYAPLGTIQAAALVRNSGYSVQLWDPMFAVSASELAPVFTEFQPEVLVIYDDGFNYLTKMCLTNMREAAFEMIRYASGKNVPVIICSSDASDHYEKYLENGALAVIRGEGENSLLEILHHLNHRTGSLDSIPGLVFRKGTSTITNPSREVMRDLDSLPVPAWDLVDTHRYREAWLTKHGYFSMNMSTTRGCPFKCNWCAKPIYGNRYNSRSPEHVVSELTYLMNNHQPDHIWFCDDIFGLKPGWVNQFADLVNEARIPLKYKIQSRVDLLLQENNIEALARSGCNSVWVGAESGSQSVLDAMDKGTTVEQIHKATKLLKKHGIRPSFFLQFGYPGETRDDINATIDMVKQLLPSDIGISVSYPLPGTPFYERVKSEMGVKTNWTDSDDLALMFRNSFPPAFYRHLHRYVHKTYRIHQGIDSLKNIFSGKQRVSFRKLSGIAYHLPGALYHGMRMRKFKELPHKTPGDNSAKTQQAFDNLAANYDSGFTHTDIGKLQRGIVHRMLRKKTDPSRFQRVLELNCGTGEDALWMSGQGFSVVATDISGEMIRIADHKATQLKLHNPPVFTTLDFNDIPVDKGESYDLVFSNFGGMNCAGPEQLHEVAGRLHKILRPGGKVIAVIMGKKCLSEKLYFTLKNSSQKNRRNSSQPVTAKFQSGSFPVWYYSPGEFSNCLSHGLIPRNISR